MLVSSLLNVSDEFVPAWRFSPLDGQHKVTRCTEHIPAIKACASLSLKAIYSRSQSSAETLLKDVDADVEAYYDTTDDPSRSLDAMLKRTDISAVIIALPILVQPSVIRKAIAAGKHVLSEKPIAKDTSTAQDLLAFYQPYVRNVTWAVGENFRVWPSITKAFEILAASKAQLVTFSVNFSTMVDPKDKYFQTKWCASIYTFPKNLPL